MLIIPINIKNGRRGLKNEECTFSKTLFACVEVDFSRLFGRMRGEPTLRTFNLEEWDVGIGRGTREVRRESNICVFFLDRQSTLCKDLGPQKMIVTAWPGCGDEGLGRKVTDTYCSDPLPIARFIAFTPPSVSSLFFGLKSKMAKKNRKNLSAADKERKKMREKEKAKVIPHFLLSSLYRLVCCVCFIVLADSHLNPFNSVSMNFVNKPICSLPHYRRIKREDRLPAPQGHRQEHWICFDRR